MSKDIPKIDDLSDFIQKGESEKLEFKKSSATLKSAAETLCAFLNANGGVVLIGVSDDKKIVGQHVTDQTQLELGNVLRKFEPTANIEVQYVDIDASEKQVIMLNAYPDPRLVPYTFDGRAYERNGSATKLSHPQQSWGFIFVSPSKGQKYEAPEGANLIFRASVDHSAHLPCLDFGCTFSPSLHPIQLSIQNNPVPKNSPQ